MTDDQQQPRTCRVCGRQVARLKKGMCERDYHRARKVERERRALYERIPTLGGRPGRSG